MSTNPHPSSPQIHGGQPSHQPQHQTGGLQALPPATSHAAPGTPDNAGQAAIELIRQKLADLYRTEPDAGQELARAEAPLRPGQQHSAHQHYMQSLHDSGKPMTDIQADWHRYYQGLPDDEKRAVWQEFYQQSAQARREPNRLEPQYAHQPEPVAAPAQPQVWQGPREDPAQTGTATQTLGTNPLYASSSQGHTGQPEPARSPQAEAKEPEPDRQTETSKPESTSATSFDFTAFKTDDRPVAVIRRQLRGAVASRGALKAKHHIQSLAFGLGFGCLVLLGVLFSFFNEVVIAPFIQPSRSVSATPIIMSPDGSTASKQNEVVIPKINVQIPLDFSAVSTEEKAFEAALDKGVAHYPTTALPGQKGNASFFGHSSNNIFNPGKYKFAFVLLNELVPGDTFYITYNGTAYTYQVYDKKVVEATAIEILNPVAGKQATAMLVTCDPPGTSLRRLAVWGEQVSPSPAGNGEAAPAAQPTTSPDLPGNGPTLWRRIINLVSGG